MLEAFDFSPPKPCTINNTSMIIFIQDNRITPTHQSADRPKVDLHSSGKNQSCFFPHPFSQFTLQLFVQFQGSIQKPRPSAARPKTINGIDSCLTGFGGNVYEKFLL